MIPKADRGKTLVILLIKRHKTKIHDFIQNNQFINLNTNPTDQYTKMIKHELNKQNIIQKEHKWKYSNMNTTAPNLHSTIKLHKQNTPIRPVVNWRNSPAYNVVKFVTKTLKEGYSTSTHHWIHNTKTSISCADHLLLHLIFKNSYIYFYIKHFYLFN
jgi:hypothetical protein